MNMKKVLFAALAVVAIASCTKNEVNEVKNNNQITFQTVVGPSTKAMIDGTNYTTTDPSFGTYAYYNATGTTFPTSAEAYIPESEVSYVAPNWTTATPYYWPKNGSLTFFSFSPWSINGSVECNATDGIVISGWDVNANQTVDVMVADVQTDKTANETNGGYNGVPTIFRHKLSQIVDVTFKTDQAYNAADGTAGAPYVAGDKLFFINYVKFHKLEQTGTYTSGNDVDGTNLGSWVLPTTPAYDHSYDWFVETTSCDTEFNTGQSANTLPYLLMMPQEYVDNADPKSVSHVEIKYTIRTFSGDSNDGTTNYSDDVVTTYVAMHDIINELTMNKKVTINFTVGVEQIYWAPSVVNWETQTADYSPKL